MTNHAFMRFCVMLGFCGLVMPAMADTLYFSDGSSLTGRVSQTASGDYVLVIKNGRMYFDAAEVARWEQNEREGQYSIFKVHSPEMDTLPSETGSAVVDEDTPLSPEEAEQVSELLRSFSSDNALDVASAREALKNLETEGDVFQFLQDNLDNLDPNAVPVTLELMTEMDPGKARDVLSTRATEGTTESRLKAMELMAESPEAGDLDALKQSMSDADPRIQLAATEALAASGDKASTEALIAGLRSADMQVRAAAEQALRELWSDDPAAGEMRSGSDWERFWANREDDVIAAAEAEAAAEDEGADPEETAADEVEMAQEGASPLAEDYGRPEGKTSQDTEWITDSASAEEVSHLPTLRQQKGTTNNPVTDGSPSGVVINKDARLPTFHRSTQKRGESPTQQRINFETEDSTPRLPNRYTEDDEN
jgi:hypothetical protein